MIFQGDFGTGQPTGSGVFSDMGMNPCVLVKAPTTAGGGIPAPQFRPGMVVNGDLGSEFVYGKLVLGAVTDLLPGQMYQLDENYTATLLSTTNGNNVLGYEVGVPERVVAAGRVGNLLRLVPTRRSRRHPGGRGFRRHWRGGDQLATAGAMKFPASATAGQKSVSPATAFGASSSITFTGTTLTGSPYVTNLASGVSGGLNPPITDLQVGMAFTMTGFTNAIIAGIDRQGPGGTWRILVGTNTGGSYATSQNSTASGSAVAGTVTSHVAANLYWPTLFKQN